MSNDYQSSSICKDEEIDWAFQKKIQVTSKLQPEIVHLVTVQFSI